jgi:hypothetical protein
MIKLLNRFTGEERSSYTPCPEEGKEESDNLLAVGTF